MDVFRVPRRGQGARRRGHLPRPARRLLRRVHREGYKIRGAHRGGRAGAHRPPGHQASIGSAAETQGLRRDIRRGSRVGDALHRRREVHRRRAPRDQDLVEVFAKPREPRPGARAKLYGALGRPRATRRIQTLLRAGERVDVLHPVHQRQPHARRVPHRRLRRVLLRLGHETRRGDSILRRSMQPAETLVVFPQRGRRRDHGRPRGSRGSGQEPRRARDIHRRRHERPRAVGVRRRASQAGRVHGLARGDVRGHSQFDSLLPRRVQLRG